MAAFAALVAVMNTRWPDMTPGTGLGWLVFGVVGSPLMVSGIRLLNRAWQLRAAHTPTVDHDARPPVRYLRAFDDDARNAIPPSLAFINPFVTSTREENLIEALHAIGPVIAIGKPGEPMPPLGAQRLYVGHDAWQDKVRELMQGARLVALMIGTSQGLWREIEQALRRLPPQRVVFFGSGRDLPPFLGKAAPWFRHPPSRPDTRLGLFTTQEYLLHFDTTGHPHFVRLRNPATMLPGNLRTPNLPVYRLALRPVFDQLGVPWSPPPIPWTVRLINIVLLGFVLGGLGYLASIKAHRIRRLITPATARPLSSKRSPRARAGQAPSEGSTPAVPA